MKKINSEDNDYSITTSITKDRSQDKIVMTKGNNIIREIPAVIFDRKQKQKLLELIG